MGQRVKALTRGLSAEDVTPLGSPFSLPGKAAGFPSGLTLWLLGAPEPKLQQSRGNSNTLGGGGFRPRQKASFGASLVFFLGKLRGGP